MQLTLVKTIFRKELRDVLRDRRTLFMMLVLPVILYPVLFIGFAQIASMQAAKIAAKQTRVAILGREHSPELAAMLDTLSGVTVADTAGWRERITASELEAALVIPDNFTDSMANRQRPSVAIYYNSSKEISQKARGQFRNVLQLFRDRVVEERLIGLSADTSVLHPFDMKIENLATEQQQQGDLLGRILGYLLIMMAVSGAFYPALDLTAGEKERGTMETLLVSPAGRDDIVYGKFLAVITISLISIILNVLSLGLTMVYLVSLVGAAVDMPAIAISPVSLLFTLLLLIPLTVIFSALRMAGFGLWRDH